MAARCEITDLLVESCAHCNGAEERAKAQEQAGEAVPSVPGPWFTARYEGRCVDCGEDIVPGDTIRSDGSSRYLCADCGALD
jgi:hypothetical protein